MNSITHISSRGYAPVTCPPGNAIVEGLESLKLVKEFCQCPAAAELLSNTSALFKTISIDVGHYPTSSAQTSGLALVNTEKLDPKTAANLLQRTIDEQTFSIFINQQAHLKIDNSGHFSRLKALAFELNNGAQKNRLNELEILANQGNLPRDDYAIGVEKVEWTTGQKTLEMLGKCQPIWKNPYDIDMADNFEDNLFSQEIHGHTDFIRRKWIDCCKKKYCAKNPSDLESCNRKKSEFINYYVHMKKTEEKRHEITLNRIAKNFHKASKRLQGEMVERFGGELTQKIEQVTKKKQTSNENDL